AFAREMNLKLKQIPAFAGIKYKHYGNKNTSGSLQDYAGRNWILCIKNIANGQQNGAVYPFGNKPAFRNGYPKRTWATSQKPLRFSGRPGGSRISKPNGDQGKLGLQQCSGQ